MVALAQLAPRQRAVVVLRYYEDLSVDRPRPGAGDQRRHGEEPDLRPWRDCATCSVRTSSDHHRRTP